MRIITLTILLSIYTINCFSQLTVRDEFHQDIRRAAGNCLAYPGPQQHDYTPAPKDKKPFYISHYGRHGSSYLIHKRYYDFPFAILLQAKRDGKLSPLGERTLENISILSQESRRRQGEMTRLGVQQQQEIIQRMYSRFPEIFSGNAHVDAKSTPVGRCILSMEYALLELIKKNPQLQITHDASEHDMYYMNLRDTSLYLHKMNNETKKVYKEFYNKYMSHTRPMLTLFNDSAYARKLDLKTLNEDIFELSMTAQNTEKGKNLKLYDIYTEDEIYRFWIVDNAWWYLNYGFSPYNGGKQPFSQRNLLRTIIEQADSCITLEKPGVALRYGHDTMILPLICLMDINGYGQVVEDMDKLEEQGWIDYKVLPMSANIQLIFYRKNLKDKDVLVKVLLNENEVTLPVKSKYAPYYRWKDVRKYYLKKLATYEK